MSQPPVSMPPYATLPQGSPWVPTTHSAGVPMDPAQLQAYLRDPRFNPQSLSFPTAEQAMALLEKSRATAATPLSAPNVATVIAAPGDAYRTEQLRQAYAASTALPPTNMATSGAMAPSTRPREESQTLASQGISAQSAALLERMGISPHAVDLRGVAERLATWANLLPQDRSRLTPEMLVTATAAMMMAEGKLALSDITPAGQTFKNLLRTCEQQDPAMAQRLKLGFELAYRPPDNTNAAPRESMASGSLGGSGFV